MPAKFKVEATFAIAGRGLIVAGEILEGTLEIGSRTRVPSWPNELTINGVEFVKRIDKPSNVGILLRSNNEDYTAWRAIGLESQIIEFDDATPVPDGRA